MNLIVKLLFHNILNKKLILFVEEECFILLSSLLIKRMNRKPVINKKKIIWIKTLDKYINFKPSTSEQNDLWNHLKKQTFCCIIESFWGGKSPEKKSLSRHGKQNFKTFWWKNAVKRHLKKKKKNQMRKCN